MTSIRKIIDSDGQKELSIPYHGKKILISSKHMRRAIDAAMSGINRGRGPFGASITDLEGTNSFLAETNSVVHSGAATRHAEINAIEAACQNRKKSPTYELSDSILYSTTKPCLMCQGAMIWSRIPILVYGTDEKDAKTIGFKEIGISDEEHIEQAATFDQDLIIVRGFLKDDCLKIFEEYKKLSGVIY